MGRGQGVVIAKSRDGVHFETIGKVSKDDMDAESLERPTLVKTPDGSWRLYLSCATTGTKHWRVEVLQADDPASFTADTRRTVLPGDTNWGVKDTVITIRSGQWHLWATCHPLDVRGQEDRMVSKYATSHNGLDWTWRSTTISGRPETWDSRGARITAVLFTPDQFVALYDGRASAEENYEERTGIAFGSGPERVESTESEPFAQSPEGQGLRYVDILPLPDGRYRLYYELTLPDGSHELRTELK
jgi:hypothetical protein